MDVSETKGSVDGVRERRRSMDSEDKLRRLTRDLEKSIERAIASSPQVEECLDRLKKEGYEAALVLEATLMMGPKGQIDDATVDRVAGRRDAARAAFKMSSLDKKFLRSLKIAVDEESS
jgi:hypothetical protein